MKGSDKMIENKVAIFTQFVGIKAIMWLITDILLYIKFGIVNIKRKKLRLFLDIDPRDFSADKLYKVSYLISKDRDGMVNFRVYGVKYEVVKDEWIF